MGLLGLAAALMGGTDAALFFFFAAVGFGFLSKVIGLLVSWLQSKESAVLNWWQKFADRMERMDGGWDKES